jgi:hypothetical protein
MKRLSRLLTSLIAALCLAIGAGVLFTVQAETAATQEPAVTSDSTEMPADTTVSGDPQVIAYYFHTTGRCVSCKKIEAYSQEAIETGFADQIKDGTLRFESVNIDKQENKHFVGDYQLYTKSVVICNMEDGKQKEWKNLTKVWQLIRNKDEFVKYVQDEINAYLKAS